MFPNFASQMRTAFSSMAWKTGSSSPGEELMMRSTSAMAARSSCASFSSWASRATSFSWPAREELLWRTALGAFALRLRALVGLLLALERRRIASLKAQDYADLQSRLQQGFAAG